MKIGRDNENAEQYIARMIREHEQRCHLYGGSVTITKVAEAGNTVAIQPEPASPTPGYKIGGWVVPENERPVQIAKYYQDGIITTNNSRYGWYDIYPATREDFMTVFLGTKVWMERHSDGVWEYYLVIGTNGRIGGRSKIQAWQADRNRAAGVIEMPEGYWEDK